jgi:hypothetical protein
MKPSYARLTQPMVRKNGVGYQFVQNRDDEPRGGRE